MNIDLLREMLIKFCIVVIWLLPVFLAAKKRNFRAIALLTLAAGGGLVWFLFKLLPLFLPVLSQLDSLPGTTAPFDLPHSFWFFLSLLWGWPGLLFAGWFVALIWSCMKDAPRPVPQVVVLPASAPRAAMPTARVARPKVTSIPPPRTP